MCIRRSIPLAGLALTAAVAGAQGPRYHKKSETSAELEKEATMTTHARSTALKEVPGATIQTGEIEREGGKLIYSFDINVAGKTGVVLARAVRQTRRNGSCLPRAHLFSQDVPCSRLVRQTRPRH